MPNIAPLVTHMANNRQLYASAGSGGGSAGGVTGLLGDVSGSVPTTSAVPSIIGLGGITCRTDGSSLKIIGSGVTGIRGDFPGSVTTTNTVPNIVGANGITCLTTTTGLTISSTQAETSGLTGGQTLDSTGNSATFNLSQSTAAGGEYVVSATLIFASTNAVTYPTNKCLVNILITNTNSTAPLRTIQVPIQVAQLPLAALSPASVSITVAGMIANTTADTLTLLVQQLVAADPTGPITVSVGNVIVQRVG